MRRVTLAVLLALLVMTISLLIPEVRGRVKAIVRPEPPAPITPIALRLPPTSMPTLAPPTPTRPSVATAAAPTNPPPTALPTATLPPPTATPEPIIINGKLYEAYIPAATKDSQAYQYSCEFDAAWVIFQTYGIDVTVDDLIAATTIDRSVEPYIEETSEGIIIHGGDILNAYSGDYTSNFLARSTGSAMQSVFERYNLQATHVNTREGIEAALRSGALVWMKTTVDFKPWRPATWLMPNGETHQTVLGNDHAVVVMGFSQDTVVIRDVLGPTSSNWERPYEYEVDWPRFMAAWEAQSFDALAVTPRTSQ